MKFRNINARDLVDEHAKFRINPRYSTAPKLQLPKKSSDSLFHDNLRCQEEPVSSSSTLLHYSALRGDFWYLRKSLPQLN